MFSESVVIVAKCSDSPSFSYAKKNELYYSKDLIGVYISRCMVPVAVLRRFNDFHPDRAMKGNDSTLKPGNFVNWNF